MPSARSGSREPRPFRQRADRADGRAGRAPRSSPGRRRRCATAPGPGPSTPPRAPVTRTSDQDRGVSSKKSRNGGMTKNRPNSSSITTARTVGRMSGLSWSLPSCALPSGGWSSGRSARPQNTANVVNKVRARSRSAPGSAHQYSGRPRTTSATAGGATSRRIWRRASGAERCGRAQTARNRAGMPTVSSATTVLSLGSTGIAKPTIEAPRMARAMYSTRVRNTARLSCMPAMIRCPSRTASGSAENESSSSTMSATPGSPGCHSASRCPAAPA